MSSKNNRKSANQFEAKKEEGLAEVISIEKWKPDIFPDLSKLKNLKTRATIYGLTRFYKSLLLEKSLIDEDDLEKRYAIQTSSDFDYDLWLAYKKMFNLSDKIAEEVNVPWGRFFRSSTSFKDLYESRWDGDRSTVKIAKKIYSGFETKQDMIEKYSKTNPQIEGFLNTVEKAVKLKRTGEVLQCKETEDNEENIKDIMEKIKHTILEIAIQTEICLVNPESKTPELEGKVENLVIDSRNKILALRHGAQKVEEDMKFGKEAVREVDVAIYSRASNEESDNTLQLVKAKNPEK